MSALVYRPPVEVWDHNDPCWIQWYVLMQQYREEEPALSIGIAMAAHLAAADPHPQYLNRARLVTDPVLMLLMAGA